MPAPLKVKRIQMTKKDETRACMQCGEKFPTKGSNVFNCPKHVKKFGQRFQVMRAK